MFVVTVLLHDPGLPSYIFWSSASTLAVKTLHNRICHAVSMTMEFLFSVIIEVRVRAQFLGFTVPKCAVLFVAISGPFNVWQRIQMYSSSCRI